MLDPSTVSRSRAWVEVDLGALRDNLRRVQQAVGPAVGLLPMVKADAYGLGMHTVSRVLAAELAPGGPWAFGVATVEEGEELRRAGWAGRVLVFSPVPYAEYARAAAAGLTPCLSEVEAVRRWREVAKAGGQRLAFHTEVDTGMGRAGFPWAGAADWGREVAAAAGAALGWEGCFTHFHSADEPELAPTQQQMQRFREAVALLPPEPAGSPRRVLHTSNSAAALRGASFHADVVRPGITLYGGEAGPGAAAEPVVALRARLVLVREVAPGTTVGYGATYSARGRERWGTVAIGYGDGLPRALSPAGGGALVHGQRVPIIGRISMDVATIDLSAAPQAGVGDVVTFIGRDAGAEITLDEVAARCGTISYEILTGLSPRLPRLYHGA